MDLQNLAKSLLLFSLLAATLILNVDDNALARLGLENPYGVAAAIALLGTILLKHQSIGVITLAMLFSLNANMPADFVLNFGYDRDIFAGLMLAMMVIPFMARILD